MNSEFSYASRRRALERFASESFDLLVIGGGITGVATARDAASRGLRVALIEKADFSSGTSSASSKLVHGGLRYLENLEFKLVFESLSERAHLVRTQPNLVRWLKFYVPVLRGDARGMNVVSLGLWLYDLLSLGRAPHFHRRLSRARLLEEIPGLNAEGVRGGFTYYDAAMWDDVMCVEGARAAADLGAAVASRCEAESPIWEGERIAGFTCIDRESGVALAVRASRTIVCAGPYTDRIGERLLEGAPPAARDAFARPAWRKWLRPSRGTHLVFSARRFPVPGALLLANDEDRRVSFVIPRADFGDGVVIVGTTDGPSPEDPDAVRAEAEDVEYLLRLLGRYFPKLGLGEGDIVSRYVGVRPLMDPGFGQGNAGGGSLAAVSREHHTGRGPGGTVLVAGGKYTTHRTMATEIVDSTLRFWEEDAAEGRAPRVPRWRQPRVDGYVNPAVAPAAVSAFRATLVRRPGTGSPSTAAAAAECAAIDRLIERYGADAGEILAIAATEPERADPAGFPYLAAQLTYAMRREAVLRLEDFYFRRLPLYLARADHAEPWIDALARVWARELGRDEAEARAEAGRLRQRIAARDAGARA